MFLREVDTPMNTMWLFTNPCHHSAITHLKNVCQLNKRKKLNISLLIRHYLTYILNYLLTYILTCMFRDSMELSYLKNGEENFSAKENFDEYL